jgi:hypothetical protein
VLLVKPEMKGVHVSAMRGEKVFDVTMSAVIIYDKFDFAAKANAILERAAQRTGESAHWRVKPWRADILKLPPAAEEALAEAAEAHLILLAMRQVQSFLPWLLGWLERWALCRQVHEAALAVWGGGNADAGSVRAIPELSRFAGRHGLSLIFEDNAMVEDKTSRLASDLRQREVSLTPTHQHILERPVRDDGEHWKHWGIND